MGYIQSQTPQPCHGQNDRIKTSFTHGGNTCVHIAAQQPYLQIGAVMKQQCTTAYRRGADDRTLGQIRKARKRTNQRITPVFTRQHSSNAWCTTGAAIVRKLLLTGPHSARPLG